MTARRNFTTSRVKIPGLSLFIGSVLAAVLTWSAAAADPADNLAAGEAYYMSGNLLEASENLTIAAESAIPVQVQRALYLLGRVSLLRGDFRQAKEYFERSADIGGGDKSLRWMSLAGIGDTLFAAGNHEEAVRRYRYARSEPVGVGESRVIDLKIALCERSLGRPSANLEVRRALEGIPVLKGWVGKEEEFYQTMVMVGIEPPPAKALRYYLRAGPVSGDFNLDDYTDTRVPVREMRHGSQIYLEIGPLTDSVEAMILSEKLKRSFSVPVEIVTK